MTFKGAIILTIVVSALVSFGVYMLSFALEDEDVTFNITDEVTHKPIMACVIILVLSLGIGIPLETECYNSQYENVVYEIKSLKSEVGASGRFFLGNGYIKTQAYYFFYVQYDQGYRLEKITTSSTYINALEESEYDTPVLTKKKNKGEWDAYNIIYIPQDYIVFEFKI